MKTLTAIGLWLAAGGSSLAAYAGKPDAKTCQFINNLNSQLGSPPSCHYGPTPGWLWAALIFAGLALATSIVAYNTSDDARVRREARRQAIHDRVAEARKVLPGDNTGTKEETE